MEAKGVHHLSTHSMASTKCAEPNDDYTNPKANNTTGCVLLPPKYNVREQE